MCDIVELRSTAFQTNTRSAYETFECTFPDICYSNDVTFSKPTGWLEIHNKICCIKIWVEFGRIFTIALVLNAQAMHARSAHSYWKINFNAKLIRFPNERIKKEKPIPLN